MLYVVYGTDRDKGRAKARSLIAALQKKKPDAELFRMDSDTFDAARLDEYRGGQGLFEKKFIVFLDNIFENADAEDVVMKELKDIAASDNIFILLEESFDKKTLTKLEKAAEKVQEIGKQKAATKKKDDFNIFSLTDALGSRNKKKLWVLYQQALCAGKAPEELHGLLFWQAKSMLLAANASNAKAAGLKPFVYTKSKKAAQNYTLKELNQISSDLVSQYHNARRGIIEFNVGLEQFVLSI